MIWGHTALGNMTKGWRTGRAATIVFLAIKDDCDVARNASAGRESGEVHIGRRPMEQAVERQRRIKPWNSSDRNW
jgi:hypothetical protein